jgi:hypothetical protein
VGFPGAKRCLLSLIDSVEPSELCTGQTTRLSRFCKAKNRQLQAQAFSCHLLSSIAPQQFISERGPLMPKLNRVVHGVHDGHRMEPLGKVMGVIPIASLTLLERSRGQSTKIVLPKIQHYRPAPSKTTPRIHFIQLNFTENAKLSREPVPRSPLHPA